MRTPVLTAAQCRAARALLRWTQQDLADRSGVACSTVRGFENHAHMPIRANLRVLRLALEEGGVILIEADDLGPGVRLRRPSPFGQVVLENGHPLLDDEQGRAVARVSSCR
jgi:transcriptional regulator with XRE-family HTH domain